MDELEKMLKPVLDFMKTREPMEPGERAAFVLDDGIVIMDLDSERKLTFDIIIDYERIEGELIG